MKNQTTPTATETVRTPSITLYVLTSNEFVKIGISSNYRLRLSQIQRHNPHVKSTKTYQLPDDWAKEIESLIKHKFKKIRSVNSSEWFQTSSTVLVDTIELYLKIKKQNNVLGDLHRLMLLSDKTQEEIESSMKRSTVGLGKSRHGVYYVREIETVNGVRKVSQKSLATKDLAAASRLLQGSAAKDDVLKNEKPVRTLKATLDEHLKEEGESGYVAKTMDEKRRLYNDFVDFFGEVPLNSITQGLIDESQGWKTWEQQSKKSNGAVRSAVTAEKRRGYLVKFFDWAYLKGYYSNTNPMNTKIVEGRGKKKETLEYTENDIERLFSPKFIEKMKKPDFYWVPLFALFSGKSFKEIARLKTESFKIVADEKCLMVDEVCIPIHSQLLSLGFWDYVEQHRTKGSEYVFPNRHHGILENSKDARLKNPEKASIRAWTYWENENGLFGQQRTFPSTSIPNLLRQKTVRILASEGDKLKKEVGDAKNIVEILKYDSIDFAALRLRDPTFATYSYESNEPFLNEKQRLNAEKMARHKKAREELLRRAARRRKKIEPRS